MKKRGLPCKGGRVQRRQRGSELARPALVAAAAACQRECAAVARRGERVCGEGRGSGASPHDTAPGDAALGGGRQFSKPMTRGRLPLVLLLLLVLHTTPHLSARTPTPPCTPGGPQRARKHGLCKPVQGAVPARLGDHGAPTREGAGGRGGCAQRDGTTARGPPIAGAGRAATWVVARWRVGLRGAAKGAGARRRCPWRARRSRRPPRTHPHPPTHLAARSWARPSPLPCWSARSCGSECLGGARSARERVAGWACHVGRGCGRATRRFTPHPMPHAAVARASTTGGITSTQTAATCRPSSRRTTSERGGYRGLAGGGGGRLAVGPAPPRHLRSPSPPDPRCARCCACCPQPQPLPLLVRDGGVGHLHLPVAHVHAGGFVVWVRLACARGAAPSPTHLIARPRRPPPPPNIHPPPCCSSALGGGAACPSSSWCARCWR